MASFRKRGTNWQVQIRREDHPPLSKSFKGAVRRMRLASVKHGIAAIMPQLVVATQQMQRHVEL